MKQLILVSLLFNNLLFPLRENLHQVTQIIKHSKEESQKIFNCHYTFDQADKSLVTTINLLSSEIEKLLNKYNDTKNIKYVRLCVILRDMRKLGDNILQAMRDNTKYGFTRFTWRLNKACDEALALNICKDLQGLYIKVDPEEEEPLKELIKEVEEIALPSKIKLLSMLRYMWKRK